MLHWLRKKTLLYQISLAYTKVLIEFDVSNNTLDNFIVVTDKRAAQTKQMSFAVKNKDISCLECQHRQEIASTGLKQGFQEGKGKGFLTNCILYKLPINQRRKKFFRLDVNFLNRCIWLCQIFSMQEKPRNCNNQKGIF